MRYIISFWLCFYTINTFAQLDTKQLKTNIENELKTQPIDSVAKLLGYKGGDKIRVSTMFSVNAKGEIINIRARAPHSIFEKEAIRIIEQVGDLKPPKLKNKEDVIRFSLPITFVIETDKERKRRLKKEKRKKKKAKQNKT
ncbi:MAG: energy transducer TonB [Flavobacteriaceae bacterium]|nr:energy transducer TonB [Flavobacteriaceae bacterium]